jgi:hypothetical protein
MANKKISELTTITTVDNAADLFPIVDTSALETKKITPTALKTALALNSVDNTTDLNKPISTATQTAINLKQDALVSATNIKTINSTSILGSGNIVVGGAPSGIAGAIQFSNGSAFSSDAANLFFDDTNNRLGIGTNVPTAQLQIKGSGSTAATTSLLVQNSSGTAALTVLDNGQVTFTERVKIEDDSTVTTQTSSVIQSSSTNANLVIAPNGTGALVANIPDGTAVGGNSRGTNAVDLQTSRTVNTQVASGVNSVVCGGYANTASSAYSTISGGQSNTASTNTHATIVGGLSNTASAQYATVVGGFSNTASGVNSVVGGSSSVASGTSSTAFGRNSTASNTGSVAIGYWAKAHGYGSVALGGEFNIGNQTLLGSTYGFACGGQSLSYLYSQFSNSGSIFVAQGDAQQSLLTARREAALTTAATTVLSLDGTGVTNLIIPYGNNRAWNVQVNWVAIVTTITGTATGISVGDTITQVQTLGFKRIGGTSSLIGTANTLSTNANTSMSTASMAYSAGGSQEMAITFTGPTFVGGGSVTMRVVARIELTEVAF